MPTDRRAAATCHVGTVFDLGAIGSRPDSDLLDRFATGHGEAAELAFAALVERHGPMVLRVCRGVLADRGAADDAFQGTFLVLATRAGTLRRRDSLASWLHGVALRVSRCERSAAIRRRDHERRAAPATYRSDPTPDDLGPIVREEFARLPERYRAPILLCDLDDQTHEAAALALGWPVGTVKSRLSRGRARLRAVLARRGLDPYARSILPVLAARRVPPPLVAATARRAARLALGSPIAGTVPASVALLMNGVRRMLVKDALRSALLATLAAAGFAFAATNPPKPPAPVPARAAGPGVQKEVSMDVRFCDMGDEGFAWREAFVDKLRLLSLEPPFTVWAIDDEATARDLLAHVQGRETANLVQAPKVTTFDGAAATIHNKREVSLSVDGDVPPSPSDLRDRVFPGVHAGPAPGPGRIWEGFTIATTPRWVEGGILAKVDVEHQRVIALHKAILPGRRAPAAVAAGRGNPVWVQVPEVSRTRLAGEWTVPDGASLLVSVGPIGGKHEQLIIVRPLKLLVDQPEAPGRP